MCTFMETRVVRGRTLHVLDTNVDQFLGIPYAEPPVGKHRFAKPEPILKPFPNIIDATKLKYSCIQPPNIYIKPELHYSEDCLVLNIWTPNTTALKPVMFWIYGGGLTMGSIFQEWYNGSALATNDVVVVSVNYRLGPFGFLYGDREDAPGNVGLYDQLLALKWVRENAHTFGGDRDQITIFGESAGSWSVSAHILSPLSKGLFKRAIMESGALIEDCLVLNIWTTNTTALKPVMFWIYGGGLAAGSIYEPQFNGSALATNDVVVVSLANHSLDTNDVVVVSVNYRLGPFGFLYGDREDAPGNVGFYDQLLGLKWVRKNIHSFGGDRDEITIFGESAGSWSVSAHILSPLSKGLFKRAIMESAALMFNIDKDVVNKNEALSQGKAIATQLKCNKTEDWIHCLRRADANDILKYWDPFATHPMLI
ncbi:unnamed protein product [Medioppia subpectinata]|uniref:Carboxylic ester hydrolase n=1 Tax=Medioppia subpectinata TaxID=1979941 RepID=A0A7R9PV33_9ACAR|nr:unnamed protein product [Medioppia subpectinata]CAG2102395.1 unnamed protein product [Medioppia subpectinata]